MFLGELALTIAKGPLEMLLGIVYGLVFGVFLWYFPSKDNVSSCCSNLIKAVSLFSLTQRHSFNIGLVLAKKD